MSGTQLPLETFPAWTVLHDVNFTKVSLCEMENKGFGLVTSGESLEGDVLLEIPGELVLSAEAVDDYAKVDHHFKQLLEACGSQSRRRKILLYLLNHLVLSTRSATSSQRGASTPWTEYIKYLPRPIPVPTMWSDEEQDLLRGSSLESALRAKLAVLGSEFEEIRETSSEIPYWNALLWEKDTARLQDWILIDAWYRSRCLELPRAGDSMVPALDMANHAHKPTAFYEEDYDGVVRLRVKPGHSLAMGEEVTISYGEAKPAAEMLFSYGFVDADSSKYEMTLQLDPLPDDPLGKAKTHIFGKPRTLKLFKTERGFEWDCAFGILACLNEEDGLDFRVLQDNQGDRQLKLFWQDEDVTERAEDFGSLIQNHPLCAVFTLRVVSVLKEKVASQLESLQSAANAIDARSSGDREAYCVRSAQLLREIETAVLEGSQNALEKQVRLAEMRRYDLGGSLESSEANDDIGV
ncbi:hypothetical protein S7711_06296 [Stachybotrys chartarum IBT 7711]|uniref:SET domain-containing protein n=1 Tax=Stachybotrys chartarum (strain CBS 109288 / IBT 7711) TaxID=1280523 RepID=A0A084B841_STACB|nr:hypothetical protein S7711_06296 [Stachybotrys chartarum IBT 7711]